MKFIKKLSKMRPLLKIYNNHQGENKTRSKNRIFEQPIGDFWEDTLFQHEK